jgi:hypothetical protein
MSAGVAAHGGRHLRHAARWWVHIAATVVVFTGLTSWLRGDGAMMLIAGGLVVGLVLLLRGMRFHEAIAVLFVWSLFAWLVAGVFGQSQLLGTTVASFVVVCAALAPIAIGYGVHYAARAPHRALPANSTTFYLCAFSGTAILAASAASALHYFGVDGIAWALAGDARNQLGDYLHATGAGAAPDGIRSLISPRATLFGAMQVATSGPHSSAAEPATHVFDAMKGLWFVTLLAAILCSLSAAAVISAVANGAGRCASSAVLAASLVPLTGIGIGIAFLEGFSTALLAAPLLALGIGLTNSLGSDALSPRRRITLLLTIAIDAVLVLLLWSFAALPLVALFLLGLCLSWGQLNRRHRILLIFFTCIAALVAAPVLLAWAKDIRDSNALAAGGSIPLISLSLLVIQPLVIVAAVMGASLGHLRRRLMPYVVGLAAAYVSILVVLALPPGPATWSYYAAKLAWIWGLATLGLVALPIARLSGGLDAPCPKSSCENTPTAGTFESPRSRILDRRAGLIIAAVATVLMVQQVSPVPSPLLQVGAFPWTLSTPLRSGLLLPSPDSLHTVRSETRFGEPIVVWRVTDPSSDRYANFLIDLYPEGTSPVFRDWAYRMTPEIQSLCALLAVEPERTVVTRLPSLEADIVFHCGIDNPRVRLIS